MDRNTNRKTEWKIGRRKDRQTEITFESQTERQTAWKAIRQTERETEMQID